MVKYESGAGRLLEIAAEKSALLIWAGIFSICSAIFLQVPYLAVYFILAELLRNMAQPEMADKIVMLHWGMIAMLSLIGGIIAMYLGGLCSHIAAFHILYKLRLRLTEHIGRLSLGYLTQTSIGIVRKTLEQNVEKIEKFIAHQLPDIISVMGAMLVMLAAMFYLHPWLTVVCLIPLFLCLALQLGMMLNQQAKQRVRAYYDALEQINASTVQYIRGMAAVKVFGQTVHSFRQLYHDIIRYRDLSVRYSDQFQNGFSMFKVVLGSILTFVLPGGIYLLSRDPGNIDLVLVLLFFLIMAPGLAVPIYKLMHFAGAFRDITEGVARIDSILQEKPLPQVEISSLPQSFDVEFDEVTFSYNGYGAEGSLPVLNNVSFKALPGRITALVGPSGSGKSTAANLIPRFWDVDRGAVKIGGIDIRNIQSKDLMNTVSFVFQDTFLFYDTLYANIAAGRPSATREEVYAAARAAQCHGFIERLPQGYDTVIGEGGTYLSGGEEQRVAVARAILKNAPILVLDEATAFADAENEYKLQLALKALMCDKTVIVIAHRLASIKEADNILVFQRGTIVEEGTHLELIEGNGLYTAMWTAYTNTDAWKLGTVAGKGNR